MNKISNFVVCEKTNWLEVTFADEDNNILHCESFGDSDEYIALLNQRCTEFETTLTTEQLEIINEIVANRYTPTEEEIAESNRLKKEQEELLEISNKKNEGIDYTDNYNNTYKVSLTAEDANGITTLKVATDEFGWFSTNFICYNKTVIPLETKDDMLKLGLFISTERAKFFATTTVTTNE